MQQHPKGSRPAPCHTTRLSVPLLTVAVAIAGLLGCVARPPQDPDSSGSGGGKASVDAETERTHTADAEQTATLRALLLYYQRSAQMADSERRTAAEELRTRLVPGTCSSARLKLAMLVTQEDGQPAEDASKLVAPCFDRGRPPATAEASLALLLRHLLSTQNQRRALADRNQSLNEERAELRRRNKELANQLEGLKSIERSLQQRNGE